MTSHSLPFDDHRFETLLAAARRHESLRWAPGTDVCDLGRSRMELEDARRAIRTAA